MPEAQSFPNILKAFTLIDYDNDCKCGSYVIPEIWSPFLSEIEFSLGRLSSEELDTFCMGEITDIFELISSSSGYLMLANVFLNQYFEDWSDFQ